MTPTRNWPGAWALRTALLLALLAAAAAGWQVAQAMPGGGMDRHGAHPGGPDLPGGHLVARLLDDVRATPEQRSRIDAVLKAAREDLAGGHQAQRDLRERSLALLAQPVLDASAAEALRQQMLAEHDRRSRRMMQAMLDAAAVLTPEQRAQWAQRMQQRREMMQRHRSERDALEGRRP